MSSMKTMMNRSKNFLNTRFINSMKYVGALTNRMGAPQGDMLSLMNPIYRRSFKCSFNSLSSSGAILYGRLDIDRVSRRRSIPKLISLSRGTLGRSSGNTYGNSHATDTDSRVGVSELESWTWTRW
ncbi:hypothetical protein BC332_14012 [Capsicum chinense]|nr:hypothetical protein BC332_14012 [Capsicum chinense]